MFYCLLKTASLYIVLFGLTHANFHNEYGFRIDVDTPQDHNSGNQKDYYGPKHARSHSWLGELRNRRDSEILIPPNIEVPLEESVLHSGSEEYPPPSDYDESALSEYDDITTTPPPSDSDDTAVSEYDYITTNPPPSDDDDTAVSEFANDDNDTIEEYCQWYNNKKKKEYKIHNETHWSGNGCKLLRCINGVVIPDPSCCVITTHTDGSLDYTLYQNHGERKITACEVMVCNSGVLENEKRIPGCCVLDDAKSVEDGAIWVASTASSSNNNQCQLGRCNNGEVNFKQLEEGEVWEIGCYNYICEDAKFQVNKVDLPGDCNREYGKCITNGTTVKLWDECKGIMCVNGKLFKGFLPECSSNDKLLYRKYNRPITTQFPNK